MFGGPLLHDIGLVGVEVLVRREDLNDAKLIMLEVPAASEVLIPAWHCACGAEVDDGFSICWSCGLKCLPNVIPE